MRIKGLDFPASHWPWGFSALIPKSFFANFPWSPSNLCDAQHCCHMLYKNIKNESGLYFSGWVGSWPGTKADPSLLPVMSSFLKVNGKYRSKSQGKGAVPMPPVAQGSTLTAKLFLFLLWLTHIELLAQWNRSQWRKGQKLQPEL